MTVAAFLTHQVPRERMEAFLHSVPYRCPLRWVTGWKCAFCGMTHSWISMFRGDVAEAFQENFFGPLLLAFTCAILLFGSFGKTFRVKPMPALPIALGVMIIYAVARNAV